MKTLDMLTPITTEVSTEATENLIEKAALVQLFKEVRSPEVDETQLRQIAHEVAKFGEEALPLEMEELLRDFYKARCFVKQDSETTRRDFATRDFDEEYGEPTRELDGWFTILETNEGTTYRYAFMAPDQYDYDHPGRLAPVAVTIPPTGEAYATTPVYRQGHGVEARLQSSVAREYMEQAFYDIFVASQRMQARTQEERDEANESAQNLLGEHMARLQNARAMRKIFVDQTFEDRPYFGPESTEGLSWVMPKGYDY